MIFIYTFSKKVANNTSIEFSERIPDWDQLFPGQAASIDPVSSKGKREDQSQIRE